MGPNVDKLFLDLNGRPVLAYSWGLLDGMAAIDEIVVVCRDGMQGAFSELAGKLGFGKPYRLVPGGKERQDSVWNGLEALSPDAEIVAIQDAARPCTSPATAGRTIEEARKHGAAVAAQPVSDTLKESADGDFICRTVDRSRVFAVQTPQTFRVEVIRRALTEVRNRGLQVTDDTAACELIGQKVKLVMSPDPNPKITRREDLPFIEYLLRRGPSLPEGSRAANPAS